MTYICSYTTKEGNKGELRISDNWNKKLAEQTLTKAMRLLKKQKCKMNWTVTE